jgi:hypothetical protein
MPTTLALIPILMLITAEPPAAVPEGKGAPAPTPKSEPAKPELSKPEPSKPELPKADPGHTLAVSAVAYPHPMISEVLFAVPSAGDSDANRSGKREVSGDEFVELVNPHDRSIDLRGYTLTDGSPTAKTTMRFTFPTFSLPPHAVVVVFNGHDAKIPGPVGDGKSGPAGVNDNFHKAAVFTMRLASSRVSFSNAGDAACLKAPDGKLLQRVRWGKADEKAGGSGFVLDEIAPTSSKGSVQRDGAGKDAVWKSHIEIDSAPFSPGTFAPFETKPATPSLPPATPPSPPVTK